MISQELETTFAHKSNDELYDPEVSQGEESSPSFIYPNKTSKIVPITLGNDTGHSPEQEKLNMSNISHESNSSENRNSNQVSMTSDSQKTTPKRYTPKVRMNRREAFNQDSVPQFSVFNSKRKASFGDESEYLKGITRQQRFSITNMIQKLPKSASQYNPPPLYMVHAETLLQLYRLLNFGHTQKCLITSCYFQKHTGLLKLVVNGVQSLSSQQLKHLIQLLIQEGDIEDKVSHQGEYSILRTMSIKDLFRMLHKVELFST